MLGRLLRRPVSDDAAIREFMRGYELPTFPSVALRALEELANPDCSLPEVASIVGVDPGITSRLLATANSAAFSLRHPVRNIDHAVSLLGRDQLESMLIAVSSCAALPRSAAPGFDQTRFWRTAAWRATAARRLARRIDPSFASETFTAALLQDMAIPVLAHGRPDRYGPVLERWHAGDRELIDLEREAFDWDHTLVADWMCQQWGFPATLGDAIRDHHGPAEAAAPLPASRLVAGFCETDPERNARRLIEAALERHDLDRDEVAGLVADSLGEADALAALFV